MQHNVHFIPKVSGTRQVEVRKRRIRPSLMDVLCIPNYPTPIWAHTLVLCESAGWFVWQSPPEPNQIAARSMRWLNVCNNTSHGVFPCSWNKHSCIEVSADHFVSIEQLSGLHIIPRASLCSRLGTPYMLEPWFQGQHAVCGLHVDVLVVGCTWTPQRVEVRQRGSSLSIIQCQFTNNRRGHAHSLMAWIHL